MTKRFLMILILSLLWGGNAYAEELKWECSYKGMNYINYQLDKDRQILKSQWQRKGGKPDSYVWNILSMNNEKVTVKDEEGNAWDWYYGTDYRVVWKGDTSYYKCVSLTQQEKVNVASMINKAKDTCKDLGFTEGTDKFADCSLKLYSQSVELAAKQNQQVVMQPQSSGSNVITIYDPVRDSRALMQQGQRMLSGACTLGIDC